MAGKRNDTSMAQKAMTMGITRTGTVKSRKTAPVVDGVTITKVVVNIPQSAREQYLEVNAAIDRGLADVAAGRVHRMSFAEYADIPTED